MKRYRVTIVKRDSTGKELTSVTYDRDLDPLKTITRAYLENIHAGEIERVELVALDD